MRIGYTGQSFNRMQEITFGAGVNETPLTDEKKAELRELVERLFARRSASGDKRDGYAAATQAANSCDPKLFTPSQIQTNPLCSSPVGGFTQWEASAELRIATSGPWRGVVFCDAGDVSQFVLFHKYPSNLEARALRFNYLHMSCGVGARYDTSVVPIRLDIGYRIHGMQILGQSDPRNTTPRSVNRPSSSIRSP